MNTPDCRFAVRVTQMEVPAHERVLLVVSPRLEVVAGLDESLLSKHVHLYRLPGQSWQLQRFHCGFDLRPRLAERSLLRVLIFLTGTTSPPPTFAKAVPWNRLPRASSRAISWAIRCSLSRTHTARFSLSSRPRKPSDPACSGRKGLQYHDSDVE